MPHGDDYADGDLNSYIERNERRGFMEYNIEFQISGLVMLVLLMGIFFAKKRIATFGNRLYAGMLITVFVACVTDIASVITLADPTKKPDLTIALAHLYLIVVIVFVAELCIYTISLTWTGSFWSMKGAKKVLLFAGAFTLILSMLISGLLVLTPEGGGRYVYTIGPAVSFTYAVGGLSLVFLFFYTLAHRRQTKLKQQMPIYVYVIVEAITTVIQRSNPYILLSSFGMVIVIFIMYFALENPDLKMIQALNDAMEDAQKADQTKNAFLANMSHEFRTPINAILGMDEMILREAESSHIIEYAINIKGAGNALLCLVNDVLDFSKIESGKMEITQREYQLSQLLRDSIALIEMKAEQKGLAVMTQVQEDLPRVLSGDEVHIRQILINLMSNAVKYTQQGKITLAVSGQKISDNTLLLQISVSDTGVGIKPEDIKRLTEAFERLVETDNRSIAGLGLGLSITTGLLTMMGSKLRVASEYGKGSVFSFELLQKVIDWEPVANAFSAEAGTKEDEEEKTTFCAQRARVLVTDDNELNLSVIQGLLKRTGIQLTTATSGMETIDLVTRNHYDLVFLDHMMPQMDGIETYQRIRSLWENGQPLQTGSDTPFIVLTANAVVGAKEMYLSKGFTDYLSKPVVAQKLEYMLKKHLARDLWTETSEEKTLQKQMQVKLRQVNNTKMNPAEGISALRQQRSDPKMVKCFLLLWEERRGKLLMLQQTGNMRDICLMLRELSSHCRGLDAYSEAVRMRHFLQKMVVHAGQMQTDEVLSDIPLLVEMGDSLIQEMKGESV